MELKMRLTFRNAFIAKTALAFGRARKSECNRPARESELGVARLRLRVQFALLLLFLTTISPVTARNPLLVARGTAVIVASRSFPANGTVAAVEAVGMTMSDADRSVEFFTKVLSFEKVSDVEVA